jgi:hypothetical protein
VTEWNIFQPQKGMEPFFFFTKTMDESADLHVKQNKPDTKRQVTSFLSHVKPREKMMIVK